MATAITVHAAIFVSEREEGWAERIKWLPSVLLKVQNRPAAHCMHGARF
jgi:hypothetical protein